MDEQRKYVITIGRQYGSGGREIGRMVADTLGIKYYDKELLTEAAKSSGVSREMFEAVDERTPSFFSNLWSFNMGFNTGAYLLGNTPLSDDSIYAAQCAVMRELAEKSSCVIVGRSADYVLRKRMAESSINVYKLLNQLLEAYTPTANKEIAEIEALAKETEGGQFQLMPWDFSYYAEKLKNRKFDFNEEALRPYFELNRVKQGVFGLATRLYGITFRENKDIPVYHPDVQAYEVYDKDGSYLAVLYTDFYPRAGKRSGAWMTSYKEQWTEDNGENSRPHVSVTMNFTKPTAGKPSLLTFSEVTTFLHEFGHALHGIFADTRFKSLSGTNVYWDFVELPSQIMENFAIERDFLNTFACHYQTETPIPDDLIQKIIDASNFNVAYACLRQVGFGLLDMAWYTRHTLFEGDVRAYEKAAWKEAQVLPDVKEACMSVQFGHIMSGGYAAGYYSYKWAEVLDADAFSLFKAKGIFDKETAQLFREHILSKGGTEHPMTLYKRFRGQEPTIDALLHRNGIK